MTEQHPSWHPDPSGQHDLRWWDGSRWTAHVVSSGLPGLDPHHMTPQPGDPADGDQSAAGRTTTRAIGWAGLAACLVAVLALAVPGVGYVRDTSADGVRLDGSAQRLDLPAGTTYGVYVDDADNSGYSQTCSAVDDADGGAVQMRDPSWSISSSDTETLDLVFDTGSGKLTVTCSVPGERVTARPLPDQDSLLLGIAVAGAAGLAGAALLVVWGVRRAHRPRHT